MVSISVSPAATAIATPSLTGRRTASNSNTSGGVATEAPSSAAHRPRHGVGRAGAGTVSRDIDGCSAATPQAR